MKSTNAATALRVQEDLNCEVAAVLRLLIDSYSTLLQHAEPKDAGAIAAGLQGVATGLNQRLSENLAQLTDSKRGGVS